MIRQRKIKYSLYIKMLILVVITIAGCLIATLNDNVFANDKTQEEITNELSDRVDKQLDDLDVSELEEFVNQLENDEKIFDDSYKNTLKAIISGKYNGDFAGLFSFAFKTLGGQCLKFLPNLLTMVAIAMVFSIIDGLSSGFMNSNTREIIYFVCYATIIVLLIGNVMALVLKTKNVVEKMQGLMNGIFPVLLTMMVALGGSATSAGFHPILSILSVSIVNIVVKFVLPCFVAMIIFNVVGNMSKNIKLEKMTKFFKSLTEFVLGLVFSFFIAFVSAQGLLGNTIDGISVKSAKFALSSYVPILGGYLTDGFDLVMASCVLIKNAVGFSGIIILLFTILAPVLQIAVFGLGLKLTAGIVEPICDKRISNLIFGISKSIGVLIAVILGVAFMFFVMIMLIMMSLNV